MARHQRETVPLEMLVDNLDALLSNTIECNSISLKRHGVAGVVLVIQMSPEQKKIALKKGFRTVKVSEDGD
jgi:hypothetical protein